MLRGQPDQVPRWEHGRVGKQPEVQLSSRRAGTTLRLTVDYDDTQTVQHLLEEVDIEIEVGRNHLAAPTELLHHSSHPCYSHTRCDTHSAILLTLPGGQCSSG